REVFLRLLLVTTFPNSAWDAYAREALASLRRFLPAEVRVGVALDDDALKSQVAGLLAAGDELITGWQPDHREFVMRYAARDHRQEYRLQATRFSHKIFFLHQFFQQAKSSAGHLIWWDADAVLKRRVSLEELAAVLPGKEEAVSYLGRKDWDHSECGFMAFNMQHAGATAILNFMHYYYTTGMVFSLPQWHDSYLFDVARAGQPCRNLSEGVPGNNVWAATALGAYSEHRKGLEAKRLGRALNDAELYGEARNA
ncbi:MAG TPA: hypothetical protein VHB73_06295, partial [Alphaproteobacteria bacterium]|nr:hypothetical protein [Alphaproteobacteria bacterium]